MSAPVEQSRPRCPVDIDLNDPDRFLSGVPLAEFARMREEQPIFWHDQPGAWGEGFWAVTRHEDIVEVSRQPKIFSSYERGSFVHTGNGRDDEESLAGMRLLMINMDPPEHTALRNIVQRVFTPRQIRAMEPRLREFADQIVDRPLETAVEEIDRKSTRLNSSHTAESRMPSSA